MSEAARAYFEPTYNRSVKLSARDHRLSSNGGAVLLREADERLGLVSSLVGSLHDPRRQELIRYHLDELLRERVYALALGYGADDEVDFLAHDPAMRMASWGRCGERVLEERGASQPTQSRLTDILAGFEANREAVRTALSDWTGRHLLASGQGRRVMRGTIDIDSFPIEVCGSQEGGGYNGYYRKRIYHPIAASFAPDGDYDSARLGDGFVNASLRPGNVHTAEGAIEFVRQAVNRCRVMARSLDVRMDAGFTTGEVMDSLTAEKIRFIGRLKGNPVLDERAWPHLVRPVGRPPKEGYEKVIELGWHVAEKWKHPQRLILVVVDRPDPKTGQLDLLPRYFFLVTNWRPSERTASELLEHYRRRGTYEDRLGELSQSIAPRLSSPTMVENEVHLLLALLAHNLLSILRGELEKELGSGWDVGRVQRTVLKTAVRITKAGRRLIVDTALSAVPLWSCLLQRISKWTLPTKLLVPKRRRRQWVDPPPHAFLIPVLRQ